MCDFLLLLGLKETSWVTESDPLVLLVILAINMSSFIFKAVMLFCLHYHLEVWVPAEYCSKPVYQETLLRKEPFLKHTLRNNCKKWILHSLWICIWTGNLILKGKHFQSGKKNIPCDLGIQLREAQYFEFISYLTVLVKPDLNMIFFY